MHVNVLGAEDLLGPLPRQVLHHVGELAPAVVAPPRVALGVFVGEDRAGRFQNRLGDKIFAGNHLQPFVLAEGFLGKGCGNFRVGLGKGQSHAISHDEILSPFPEAIHSLLFLMRNAIAFMRRL